MRLSAIIYVTYPTFIEVFATIFQKQLAPVNEGDFTSLRYRNMHYASLA